MSNRADNEMGQIQRGLEDFLERELQMYTIEKGQEREKELNVIGGRESKKAAGSGRRAGEGPQVRTYQFYGEDWDRESDRNVIRHARQVAEKRVDDERQPMAPKTPKNKKATKDRRDRREKKPKKRKSRWKRFLFTAVLILALVGIGLYQLVGIGYRMLRYEEIESVAGKPLQKDGVVNILLIGNDSRENGEDGRSDAMILLSVSRKTKSVYMISLLRDMYVDIPGRDGNRLNAAYSYGGPELLMKTVEQNLGIPVHRYMQVNFEAFANLVDAVGGVDLELSTQELEYVNGYLVEYNMLTGRPQGTDNMDTSVGGMVHLNGPQALAYCRNRYLGTDFGRTERQRKVLSEAIKKMPPALATRPGELLEGVLPNLTTNLTQNECFQLSLMSWKFLAYDIVSDNIPQPGTYSDANVRGMSVLKVDFETNRMYLRMKLYGEE